MRKRNCFFFVLFCIFFKLVALENLWLRVGADVLMVRGYYSTTKSRLPFVVKSETSKLLLNLIPTQVFASPPYQTIEYLSKYHLLLLLYGIFASTFGLIIVSFFVLLLRSCISTLSWLLIALKKKKSIRSTTAQALGPVHSGARGRSCSPPTPVL